MSIRLNVIVACCEGGGIGINGELPWRLRKEMQHFSRLTRRVGTQEQQSAVVMGRKTWVSIPEKFRPLPHRLNYVLTTSKGSVFPGAEACNSLEDAIERYGHSAAGGTLWAIGGHSIYEAALKSPFLYRVYVTRVHASITCDTFLPPLPPGLTPVSDSDVSTEQQLEGDITYHYEVLQSSGDAASAAAAE
uniref:dihydrofolate reductase n=1 Tax=Hirondellea gigas TaxID=1518452 RepID=A0A2P2I0L3_9CRUS